MDMISSLDVLYLMEIVFVAAAKAFSGFSSARETTSSDAVPRLLGFIHQPEQCIRRLSCKKHLIVLKLWMIMNKKLTDHYQVNLIQSHDFVISFEVSLILCYPTTPRSCHKTFSQLSQVSDNTKV